MQRINYQHLFYFWHVVTEGSITAACEKLHLAQPTISGQLTVFEQAIGEKLFYKANIIGTEITLEGYFIKISDEISDDFKKILEKE